ncbi:MAG: hypothetical protein IPG23_17070 [Burkholderiales bacterium]|nr:hypothetical protein [Burkholderiales bacterium]
MGWMSNQSMGKLRIFVLAGLVFWVGVAEAKRLIDKPLTYLIKNSDNSVATFSFPFIQGEDDLVAKRINVFLHVAELQMAPPELFRSEPLQAATDSARNNSEMESGGIRTLNEGRVLSVGVIYVNRGYAGKRSYEFDARNGRLLLKDELLTPAGYKLLAKQLVQLRKSRIRSQLSRLTKLLGSHTKKSPTDTPELIREEIDIYKRCLEDRFEGSGLKSQLDDPGILNVEEHSLIFTKGPCSNQSIDELGDFTNKLSAEEVKPYLSSYGKYILFAEGDGAISAINPYSQVFWGKINGKIPVTLYLGSNYPLIREAQLKRAKYYYDKYRSVIDLSVEKRGDLFELTETDSKEIPKPVLSFKIYEGKLTGQWRGGGKSYSFEAAP